MEYYSDSLSWLIGASKVLNKFSIVWWDSFTSIPPISNENHSPYLSGNLF